ncbi:hypothetical protein Syun_006211 [Stephania yunnanensis]|uniref:Adenosylhomocysteinase n=1 Tax=Stephania yunnanensis TaxID=152371 RepID=A0AAP0KYT0_9MAGN
MTKIVTQPLGTTLTWSIHASRDVVHASLRGRDCLVVPGYAQALWVLVAARSSHRLGVRSYDNCKMGAPMCKMGVRGRVVVTEVDPICALQALMEGFQVLTMEDVVSEADIFVAATGNRDFIMVQYHMKKMKNNVIVCNIGHFDDEIDIYAWIGEVPERQEDDRQASNGQVGVPGVEQRQRDHCVGRGKEGW